jgi:DNA repair protein RadC
MADSPLDGSGHRARLRQRLFEGGPDALLDHELVEYLLALALPRRDTKPLAKKLIHEFGGFGGLLSAEGPEIARIGEVSEGAAAAIKIAQAAALRLLEDGIPQPAGSGQLAGAAGLSARGHGALGHRASEDPVSECQKHAHPQRARLRGFRGRGCRLYSAK